MTQIQKSEYPGPQHRRPNLFSGAFLAALFLVFITAFGYASYLFFQTAKTIVLNAPQISQEAALTEPQRDTASGQNDATQSGQEGSGNENSTVSRSPVSSILAPLWNEQGPINILLLGIDKRPGERGAFRTDTMIVLNIDPATGDVGMLSLPRDLWVMIPGFYESRINAAHFIGDAEKYPGGGPALAKETVAAFLGQPIHYYVRINFEGFRALLEEIGCIEIDVPKDISDPTFPDDNYGYDPFEIKAGHYCMEAETALKYARTRHVDSDFGRMKRQQQVILAIKDKVLNTGELPRLLSRLPALLNALSDSIQTDMPTSQQITLANLARKLNTDNIRRLVIDETMTTPVIRESGAYVLLPDMDVIKPQVDAFFNPSQSPTPDAEDPIRSQLAEENARISILNGTSSPELAQKAAEWLATQGYNVIAFSDADRSDYSQTQIIDYSNKTFTLQQLANLLSVVDENIRPGAGGDEQVDIQIILGADFRLP